MSRHLQERILNELNKSFRRSGSNFRRCKRRVVYLTLKKMTPILTTRDLEKIRNHNMS